MLDIQNLSKTFNPGTVNEKKALSSLSLHLDEGDFVTIVGSNGAGDNVRNILTNNQICPLEAIPIPCYTYR